VSSNPTSETKIFMSFKILLCGDDCVDIYQFGHVDRLSPEAPVPVFKLDHYKKIAGMAGNVKSNLKNLGCNVVYKHTETNIKTRIIDIKSGQHIVRIDDDRKCKPLVLDFTINDYDAVVISDYVKGTITYEFVETVRNSYQGPIFIDTKKKDLARFEGCYVKINDHEYESVKTLPSDIIITLGKNGAMYRDKTYPGQQVEVVDVCGAGDTFLSALCYQYLLTTNIEDAILVANKAASVTVQHQGVYAPKIYEFI